MHARSDAPRRERVEVRRLWRGRSREKIREHQIRQEEAEDDLGRQSSRVGTRRTLICGSRLVMPAVSCAGCGIGRLAAPSPRRAPWPQAWPAVEPPGPQCFRIAASMLRCQCRMSETAHAAGFAPRTISTCRPSLSCARQCVDGQEPRTKTKLGIAEMLYLDATSLAWSYER